MHFILSVRSWVFRVLMFLFVVGLFPSSGFAATFVSQITSGTTKLWSIQTPHFIIEFSQEIRNGMDSDRNDIPDLVERVGDYAETSWAKEVNELGFPNPIDNYKAFNPSLNQQKIYLILDDTNTYIEEDILGGTSLLTNGAIFMAINPALSDGLLKVTTAHELVHVIQFSYQGNFIGFDQDLNFAEQTAVSIEDYVFNEVNDYYNYLPQFFANTDYSVFTGVVPPDSLFEYALSIWPRFLVEWVDDWTLVPRVIQAYFDEPVPDVWDSYEAYRHVLQEDYDQDLRVAYQDFALSNYLPELYVEGSFYPRAIVHALHRTEEYPLRQIIIDEEDWPALFGSNIVQFEIDDSYWGQDFRFILDKPAEVDMGVVLLPETLDDYLIEQRVSSIIAAGQERGTITLPIDQPLVMVTALVTPFTEDARLVDPADEAFSVGYEYSYSVEIGDFLTNGGVEVEVAEEGELEVSVEPEVVKSGEAAGSNLPQWNIDLSGLDEWTVRELTMTNKDDDSVSLSWSRTLAEGINGYEVHYGLKSGVYDAIQAVTGAHITHATIQNLLPGETYYFVVRAVDGEDNPSANFSNEVSAGLDEVRFSDVPFTHRHAQAIQFLSSTEIFSGYPDGKFRPEALINRAELTKVLTFSDVEAALMDRSQLRNCFPDVTTQWFAPYVCYAYQKGWVKGYDDGLFHPERNVTKAEALKMVIEATDGAVEISSSVRATKVPYRDVYTSAWYAPYVAKGVELGLLEEPTVQAYGPNVYRTRSEVAELIFRYVVIYVLGVESYDEERLEEFKVIWAL